ncbi:MAG: hypothetical protein KKE59_05170 [Proteobacteria bacterium]|uniref:Uncharacterized protein n=1 Tax=Candidatus Desulfatibia profunda TaxID=2841695 RepID=A0A8J6NT48_9BACT|nr:hypothetical protein [Candidatus Desulfatibia profunda]MBU0698800.1 hypothetical protein [Pseudomonadota bacterium]
MYMGGCTYNAKSSERIKPDTIEDNRLKSSDDLAHQIPRARVEKAHTLGLAAILREQVLTVGEIWLLQKMLKSAPNKALQQMVNDRAADLAGHPFERLINPSTPYANLPEDPGCGLTRFYNYILAPFGTPKKRAISFIDDFLSTDESGYVLTHQFIVLEWAEQTCLELPEQLEAKRKKLLDQILWEQLADKSFSDLYVERVAILLYFGDPDAIAAAQWIKTIVNAQLPDGSWGLYTEHLSYDGQSITGKPGTSHTIVLALLSLRAYLDKY